MPKHGETLDCFFKVHNGARLDEDRTVQEGTARTTTLKNNRDQDPTSGPISKDRAGEERPAKRLRAGLGGTATGVDLAKGHISPGGPTGDVIEANQDGGGLDSGTTPGQGDRPQEDTEGDRREIAEAVGNGESSSKMLDDAT